MKSELNGLPAILVLDNDEDDLRFIEEAMSRVSPLIPVHYCTDADRFIEMVEKAGPEIIFIEYRLQQKNGIECIRRLRSHLHFRGIPVIMWSTVIDDSIEAAAHEAGIQLVVEKPWEIRQWTKRIKMVLQSSWRLSSFIPSWLLSVAP